MRQVVAVGVVVGLFLSALPAQVSAQVPDLDRMALETSKRIEMRAPRVASNDRSNISNIYDQQFGTGDYKIRIGLYGVYPPSIKPTKNWVQISCISEPGRNYPGSFSLIYVDVILFNAGVRGVGHQKPYGAA